MFNAFYLKEANTTPMFKKGSCGDLNNYRPISIACMLCTVLGSLNKDLIVNHIVSNNLYDDCQCGFCAKCLCVSQLPELHKSHQPWKYI